MKNLLFKTSLGQSLASIIILGIFILVAIGSFELDYLGLNMTVDKEKTANGEYKETEHHQYKDAYKITTGMQDGYGRWHGQVQIKWLVPDQSYTEDAFMEHGTRQGLSTRTYPDGHKVEGHYLNGTNFGLEKAAQDKASISAYQRLADKYPWYLFSLNGWGFEEAYVERFIDTIEVMLNAQEFAPREFDNYYEDVLSSLEETPFDSIISFNTELIVLQGLTELKNSELRMAVIDYYRSGENSIYDVISTTYQGYLRTLNDSGITNHDFEVFCQDLEDTLANYGTLDPEDPFFTDSVDSRLFMALPAILDIEIPASVISMKQAKNPLKLKRNDIGGLYGKFNPLPKPLAQISGSSDVALLVVSSMLLQLYDADMIRKAVRETYLSKKGIISVPKAATAFSEFISATSALVDGYIVEDGGAEITTWGIAWATFYNPTTSDNISVPPPTSSTPDVILAGLVTGTTYYARTFATNSAGTGYGNCISFMAGSPTGIFDNQQFNSNMTIYPNPASEFTNLGFRIRSSATVTLIITDIKGQIVYQKDQGRLPLGENHIRLDLSGLPNGIYECVLRNGTLEAKQKLVIY